MHLNILATTDVHGYIHGYDYVSDSSVEKGLWGLKDYIQDVKSSGHTVLLDIGDSFQGNPISHIATYMYSPQSHPMKIAYEKLGYDAVVVGNHDFNYGHTFVDSIFRHSKFAYMAANVLRGGKTAFIPFLPVEIEGVKLAFLAITTPAVPWFEHPDNIKPYTFQETIETLRTWLPTLKYDFDHIILLAHMGFEKDPETGERTRYLPFENALYEVLNEFGGDIPLIFHGHTHERKEPAKYGGTYVVTPPPYAEGLMHISVEADKDKFEIKDIKLVPSNVSEVPAFIKDFHRYTVGYMNSVIGTLESDLEFTPVKDSSGMEFLLSIMEKYSGADISVQSFMGREPFVLPAGEIHIKDIFRIYPYENMLYVLKMTGEEILSMLEKTAEYFTSYTCEDNKAELVRNPLVAFYNFDIYRGFSYTIDLSKPMGSRVFADLDRNKEYTIAVNSYRAGGSGGYTVFRQARERGILYSSDISIRDLIIRDIMMKGNIGPIDADGNWYFLPECIKKADSIVYEPV